MNTTVISKKLKRIEQAPVLVSSHPRSGTHLVLDMLRRQFHECDCWKWPGQPLNRVYLGLENLFEPRGTRTSDKQALEIIQHCRMPLIKTHYLMEEIRFGSETHDGTLGAYWSNWIKERATRLYVYRDGRDVMCSLHRWRQGFDPKARVPISEFIRTPMDGSGVTPPRYWVKHVRCSLRQPQVLSIKFERLIKEPEEVLREIAKSIRCTPRQRNPILPERTRVSKWERVKRRLSHRPANTIIDGRYRGKPPVKWRHVFREDDRRLIHQEAGDLLVELGYEDSAAWID